MACTFDFGAYDAAIENCPVLDPISSDELAMYCDFVRLAPDFDADVLDSYYSEAHGLPRDWQDYDELRRHAEEEAADLPDLRGPLEKPYLAAYRAHRAAVHSHSAPPADPRPPFLTTA